MLAGRGMTFYQDEWSYIVGRRGWSVATFLTPHVDHWSTVPVLIYKVLLETVGLRSYVPYQAVVVILHLVTAAALFSMVRREAGAVVALCGALVFLLLGSGGEDLFWGAEIGWNAAMAAGGWALALTLKAGPTRHRLAIPLLLLIAVASSNIGLIFVGTVGLALLLTPERRRQLWLVAPAIIAFGLWYIFFGRSSMPSALFTADGLKAVPEYVIYGIGNAMGRLTGWTQDPGLLLAVLLIAATAWRGLSSRPLLVGAVIGVAGVLALFFLTALTRASAFGPAQSAVAHYVYLAAFFLLMALASWLSTLLPANRRPGPRQLLFLSGLVAVAVAANLVSLYFARSSFLAAAENVRATISVISRYGGSPAIPADRGVYPIPGRGELDSLLMRYGSPLRDVLAPVSDPSAAALDRALVDLAGHKVTITPAAGVDGLAAPSIVSALGAAVGADGSCAVITPTGPAPVVVVEIPPGGSLIVHSTAPAEAEVRPSIYGAFVDAAARRLSLVSAQPLNIGLPDLGPTANWLVQFRAPSGAPTSLCLGGNQ
jgi:hypothetical protein